MISVRIWFVIRTNSVWYNFGEIFSQWNVSNFWDCLNIIQSSAEVHKKKKIVDPPLKKNNMTECEDEYDRF